MTLSKLTWRRTGSEADATDEQLIRSVVREHYDFIWRVLRRLGVGAADVDDAAQQVFIIAARHVRGVEQERIRSFLYGTALRVASNHRRTIKRRREELRGPERDSAAPSTCHAPERQVELCRACMLLDELLAMLPDKLRRVLILAEIEQLEVPEIADLEGIARGTAASRLRLARSHFAGLLQRNADRNPFGSPP